MKRRIVHHHQQQKTTTSSDVKEEKKWNESSCNCWINVLRDYFRINFFRRYRMHINGHKWSLYRALWCFTIIERIHYSNKMMKHQQCLLSCGAAGTMHSHKVATKYAQKIGWIAWSSYRRIYMLYRVHKRDSDSKLVESAWSHCISSASWSRCSHPKLNSNRIIIVHLSRDYTVYYALHLYVLHSAPFIVPAELTDSIWQELWLI